ncbi:hypothetical protein TUM4644_17280 [Shewanella colwelliana]|uniref:hypothetical protein n=1 Tax=Shewanella colwelliana TaxID=23 RepID=UPI001BC0D425|nr:hypothetical protein [Shewanella colwelliana]GIU23598.1 hypothetical protein TUM4644_17280 [Shewanella colwelliana]
MNPSTLTELLTQFGNNPRSKPAFIIGNGINRYGAPDGAINAWDTMLLQLYQAFADSAVTHIPHGISLTEFYDSLTLINHSEDVSLQKAFCALMADWQPTAHHNAIVEWAKAHNAPILTTNFEETLSADQGLNLYHSNPKRFTDYYPWGSHFAPHNLDDPTNAFAIWHINGMQRYARSVRLGLSHYMGSVERARALLHKGGKGRLFANDDLSHWNGSSTWLQILFSNDLVFIGLGLESSEIFIRWLLIERAKYFKAYPQRQRAAYFIYAQEALTPGQTLFLSAVGVTLLKQDTYQAIYETPWAS